MSDTTTLVRALRVLARDIHCDDGVATQCITEAADAIERLLLTDEEREAIENCIYASVRIGDDWSDKQAATLRSLLERL